MARAMMIIILMSVAATTMLFHLALAVDHNVGAPNGGWDTFTDLESWASAETFTVGDNLVFTYGGFHSVLEVTKDNYDSCSTSSPISTSGPSPTTFSLTGSGIRYFICGTAGHCDQGMKVEIQTIPTATPPPPVFTNPPPSFDSPAPAAPPVSTVAPPPTLTSPPPSSDSPAPAAPPVSTNAPPPTLTSPPPSSNSPAPAAPPVSTDAPPPNDGIAPPPNDENAPAPPVTSGGSPNNTRETTNPPPTPEPSSAATFKIATIVFMVGFGFLMI